MSAGFRVVLIKWQLSWHLGEGYSASGTTEDQHGLVTYAW